LAEAPSSPLSPERLSGGVAVWEILSEVGLTKSRSEARRLIQQGGVSVNNQRVASQDVALSPADVEAGAILLRVGKKKYGPTPADIEWWGEDAAEGREVTFVFELEDHESSTVVRTLRGKEVAVDAMLAPTPQPVRRVRPSRPKPPPKPTGPVVIPKSFKDDPY